MRPRAKGQTPKRAKDVSLRDLARLRQGAYRLFSQSLLYPSQERLGAIPAVARAIEGDGELWFPVVPLLEWSEVLQALKKLDGLDPVGIQGEYLRLFSVSSQSVPCLPYESAYVGGEDLGRGWALAQLEAKYAEVGLAPSPTLREPADHVSTELEFMSFLCDQEAQGWEAEEPSQALGMLRQEDGFLNDHLARWFPQFASKLKTYAPGSVFSVVANAAQVFLAQDASLVDSLVQRFTKVSEGP